MSKPTLGYWDSRGCAQQIRYMLKYAKVDFNDKRYLIGEGNSFAEIDNIQKHWIPEKNKLGLEFPNLPYYIDGDVKLTQSISIMRYLARKYGLWAKDECSMIKQDLAEQQLTDFRILELVSGLFYNVDFEKLKDEAIAVKIPGHLQSFSIFLGQNKWFSGDTLTYVDFIAYEAFDWVRIFIPKTFQQYPNLVEFMKRFKSIPTINEYLNSNEFKNWPLIGPMGKFGHFN